MEKCTCSKTIYQNVNTRGDEYRLLDIHGGHSQPLLRYKSDYNRTVKYWIYNFQSNGECITDSWITFELLFKTDHKYSDLLCYRCKNIVLNKDQMDQLKWLYVYSNDLDRDLVAFLEDTFKIRSE